MIDKNLKSMQESMLEYVVVNYREVFSSILQGTASRQKILPPDLFEKIISKSKEMKWCIRDVHVEKLLPYRDVLRWKNIDVILHYKLCTNHILKSKDVLNLMSQVEYPLRKLSIYMERISEESMNALCTMGSTIECLDLTYDFRDVKELLKGPFPKLRKLNLTFMNGYHMPENALYIDLSRFSDTLEELKLLYETLDDRSTRSIASLKNLKVLSLPYTFLNYDYFNESLSSMTYLRTLDIRYLNVGCMTAPWSSACASISKLLSTISKMPDLENLDTPRPYLIRVEDILEPIKCKKWKKLGNYDIYADEFQSSYSKFKKHADQVFGLYEETLLSTFEIYVQDALDADIICTIFKFIQHVPQEQLERFENIILNSLAGYLYPLGEITHDYILTGRCTDDFVTKLVTIMCGDHDEDYNPLDLRARCAKSNGIKNIITSAPVARKMLEIVEKDLNKGLSKKLLNMLFVCSYHNLNEDIRELGLQDVCDKAFTNNFFDDDAMMGMKTLLKKINKNL